MSGESLILIGVLLVAIVLFAIRSRFSRRAKIVLTVMPLVVCMSFFAGIYSYMASPGFRMKFNLIFHASSVYQTGKYRNVLLPLPSRSTFDFRTDQSEVFYSTQSKTNVILFYKNLDGSFQQSKHTKDGLTTLMGTFQGKLFTLVIQNGPGYARSGSLIFISPNAP